jgi:secreted PhoX family phosphatase
VPAGYRWIPILRWGDPLFAESPDFHPEAPDAHARELQFSYDFLAIMDIDRLGRSALLCCNHELTNRAPPFGVRGAEARSSQGHYGGARLQRCGVGTPRRPPAVALRPRCGTEPADHRAHNVHLDWCRRR